MSRFSTRRARVATSLAALTLSALALSACAGGSADEATAAADDESASHGDITLQLSWIKNEEFAGEYFADSEGYYTEAGFDSVTLVPGPSGGIPEIMSGTADISISDAVQAGAAIANEGAPIKIIGATFQANPFTVLSLADGGDIATPEDLKGKKIGVQDSNMTLFNALLDANDIDPSELTIVPVQYDPAPLLNGEVDGFMAYLTNEAISVEMEGFATTNFPLAENGMPFVAEVFIVTDEKIASDREMLKAFLAAEIKGWTDAVNDAEAGAALAVDVYGKDLGLDLEKAVAGSVAQNLLIDTEETRENGLFTVSEKLQKETITTLERAGITVTADVLFDMSLLAEVYEQYPELIAYAG
ncbi:ABC transporter substrate-binding protein [Microbacterium caowuchunii]|uniref:Thiamine pyrimidine synthase n=1 Tax=Microbacterium caowuchunii TaxID=2614638 RepID=A0A5N0THH1_9MICO|nr:ABC transporter substrate-binding protein [Microbacterium caowuchunii]KAA9134565.1 ABC transporter substrate-binding protein [Microbacterium caowuchunii]